MFEQAEPHSEHVITRDREANANLRTQLHRIIRHAGLEPWPKTFQILRSTRETELAEVFPIHVVCKWIGNSELVATAHYLQITDDHFKRAVDAEGFAQAAQNAAQKAHEPAGAELKDYPEEKSEDIVGSGDSSDVLLDSETFENASMTRAGLEPALDGF